MVRARAGCIKTFSLKGEDGILWTEKNEGGRKTKNLYERWTIGLCPKREIFQKKKTF